MARRQPAPRTTKAAVADAALALFADRGYAQVTVDEIATRAGVTKGAFYYYYADKADVATDLWRELWQRLADEAQRAMDPRAGAAENLRACLRAMLDGLGDLGEARFFLREAWSLPEIEVAGRRDQEAAVPLIEAALRDATGIGPRSEAPAVPTSRDPHVARSDLADEAIRASVASGPAPSAERAADGAPGTPDALVEAAARVLVGAFAEAVLYILTTGQSEATLRVLDHVVEAVVAVTRPARDATAGQHQTTARERARRPHMSGWGDGTWARGDRT